MRNLDASGRLMNAMRLIVVIAAVMWAGLLYVIVVESIRLYLRGRQAARPAWPQRLGSVTALPRP
jgi:hypothetical protein